MTADELLEAGALTQGRAIAEGQFTPAALFEAQQARIAERNPALNAFVQRVDGPPALELRDAASPLAGVGFAVKDNIDVQGLPSHAGLRALHATPATRDATAVARLKAAGMPCLGKLNMHAVALGATNHNAGFGDAFNPRREGHTPGGSSGGSGAAVAAGLCAVALGTDTMGSVRIPAAYCGVVGFKPSFDEIPVDGVLPLCRVLDHVGILARDVADVAAVFRWLSDSGTASGQGDADPAASNAGASGKARQSVLAIPADIAVLAMTPEVRDAYAQALARLRARGFALHQIVLAGYDFTRVRRAGLLLCEAELLVTLAPVLTARRDEIPADLRAMLDFAAGKTPADIARAVAALVDAGQRVRRLLRPFDALLLPTAGQTAFPMSGPVPHDQADFTAMANVSGGPALSLPLPRAAGELPIGLQLIGRRGQDAALLRLAAQVDAALGT